MVYKYTFSQKTNSCHIPSIYQDYKGWKYIPSIYQVYTMSKLSGVSRCTPPPAGLTAVPQICSESILRALPSRDRLRAASDSRPACPPVAAADLDSTPVCLPAALPSCWPGQPSASSDPWPTVCSILPDFASSCPSSLSASNAPRHRPPASYQLRAGRRRAGRFVRFRKNAPDHVVER